MGGPCAGDRDRREPPLKGMVTVPTYNRVQLLGHAAANAEMRLTVNGKELATFTIATGSKPYVQWHNVQAWGKIALLVAKIKKGDLVEVHGNLKNEKYKGVLKTSINAQFIYLMNHKKDWDESVAQARAEREQTEDTEAESSGLPDDDIPF